MRQQAHPNVLTLHCSFVNEHQLWMVGCPSQPSSLSISRCIHCNIAESRKDALQSVLKDNLNIHTVDAFCKNRMALHSLLVPEH